MSAGFLYSADLNQFQWTWSLDRHGNIRNDTPHPNQCSQHTNLRCSSISFGVTQITCCPFQYFTKFKLYTKWREYWSLSSDNYLQGGNDVTLGDAGHRAELLDAEGAPEVPENFEEDPRPVRPIGELSQVRQRLLRAARHLPITDRDYLCDWI